MRNEAKRRESGSDRDIFEDFGYGDAFGSDNGVRDRSNSAFSDVSPAVSPMNIQSSAGTAGLLLGFFGSSSMDEFQPTNADRTGSAKSAQNRPQYERQSSVASNFSFDLFGMDTSSSVSSDPVPASNSPRKQQLQSSMKGVPKRSDSSSSTIAASTSNKSTGGTAAGGGSNSQAVVASTDQAGFSWGLW